MTRTSLVIGYGNVLRSDDGIGWHVTERLTNDPRFEGVAILQRHQLTPELALDLSRAALVAMVDASRDRPPGTFTIAHADPGDRGVSTWSHRMEPATLVTLARELYGHAPETYVVSVGAASLDAGERLSPALEAAVPDVVEALADLLATRTRPGEHAGVGHA